jgi:outer membrane murein-binding lipoprotein Lpp
MEYRYKIVLVLCGSLLLSGCDSLKQIIGAQDAIATQAQQLVALRQEVDSLKSELAQVKKEQAPLQVDKFWRDIRSVAYLEPGDAGYSVVPFDLGNLTVQLSDVKPYANGSKVTLKFGNPLSSSINGLKATVQWGRVDAKGSPDNTNEKSKDFTFTETLRSGAWTSVPVVLDGVPPNELGFVRISAVSHTGISLSR